MKSDDWLFYLFSAYWLLGILTSTFYPSIKVYLKYRKRKKNTLRNFLHEYSYRRMFFKNINYQYLLQDYSQGEINDIKSILDTWIIYLIIFITFNIIIMALLTLFDKLFK